MWAYNKATALTGGLLSLLDTDLPNVRENVTEALKAMTLDWGGPSFWSALKAILQYLDMVRGLC